ncbi:hypothetical protein LDENG_00199780 [Lucifuga dentata]|nr:hypothetical protein LDENG_00199780 [Lucifuga dentata]
MVVTQESILSLLMSEGGKVKKSELVGKFKGSLDCADPAEKERNKELFKTFVNNVAFVKEIDGVRYVVVKKKYHHMLEGAQPEENRAEKTGNEETELPDEEQSPAGKEQEGRCEDGESSICETDQGEGRSENPAESFSPILLALQRSKTMEYRVKRALNFQVLQSTSGETCSSESLHKPNTACNKPYALPLRMPPTAARVEHHRLKSNSNDPPESPNLDTFRNKRKPGPAETGGTQSSPQLRRVLKSTKLPEEPKEHRFPSMVPLEQTEHEWLVRCASGHWSQVYGLLLRDNQLAEKRDFMSGFTALHWAAKCGNSEMLAKIIELSRQGGVDVDINAKTYGGYTPLHIAALHDQEFILAKLAGEYGASVTIRDNCGKRAYHYLHKGISGSVREMLGEPKAQQQAQDCGLHEKDELDLFPDLSKGLHTISRLFQPHVTGHKKKSKQSPGFYSLTEEPGEEQEDRDRYRVLSDVFM